MNGKWSYEKLIDRETSDMILVDFDEDGEKELLTFSPFHGDILSIYKIISGKYELVYTYEKPLKFLHAIWGGILGGKAAAVIGHRDGERDLLLISYDNGYKINVIDHNVGSANVLHFKHNNRDRVVAAHRETDEIAIYTFE